MEKLLISHKIIYFLKKQLKAQKPKEKAVSGQKKSSKQKKYTSEKKQKNWKQGLNLQKLK